MQVETFGSMKREEKVGFILEQMRLCLAKKDYIRTQIICKKINTKFFNEVDTPEVQVHLRMPSTILFAILGLVELLSTPSRTTILLVLLSPSLPLPLNPKELKLKYYRLMIEMCHYSEEFLQISKHYHSVYETGSVQQDEARRKEVSTCELLMQWSLITWLVS